MRVFCFSLILVISFFCSVFLISNLGNAYDYRLLEPSDYSAIKQYIESEGLEAFYSGNFDSQLLDKSCPLEIVLANDCSSNPKRSDYCPTCKRHSTRTLSTLLRKVLNHSNPSQVRQESFAVEVTPRVFGLNLEKRYFLNLEFPTFASLQTERHWSYFLFLKPTIGFFNLMQPDAEKNDYMIGVRKLYRFTQKLQSTADDKARVAFYLSKLKDYDSSRYLILFMQESDNSIQKRIEIHKFSTKPQSN